MLVKLCYILFHYSNFNMHIKINEKRIKRILIVILSIGITLSFINFFNFRSLWLDEALLSKSIVHRNFSELLLPLEYDQVAPIGFLYFENIFSTLFGNLDWSLRIFPFLSFLIAIGLIYKLNKLLFKSTLVALLAACLFCLNTYVLYYSIEIKQYMSDVLICLLIIIGALHYFDTKTKKAILMYSSITVLSVWFSNVAIIILFTVGLIGLFEFVIKDKLRTFINLLPISLGILSFLLYYVIFIYGHPAKETMLLYWSEKNGFLYKDLFSWEFRYFIRSRIQSLFMLLLELGSNWFVAFFFIVFGFISNFKNKKAIFILVFPIVVHLILSYFKFYPFDKRFLLYMFPILISFIAIGLYNTYICINRSRVNAPVYLLLIPIIINMVAVFKKIPMEKEEVKQSMQFINNNIENIDKIYVYSSTKIPFEFYKNRFEKIKENTIIYGENNSQEWDKHKDQLKTLQKPIWLIFSHIGKKEVNGLTEEGFILENLSNNGYYVIQNKKYVGATVYKMLRQ